MSEVPLYGSNTDVTPDTTDRVRARTRPVQGYLADRKAPPPQDHHRALGIGLR